MRESIPVGVLVERAAIHKAVIGRTPHEDFSLYAQGAPCPVCFFSFSDLDLTRRTVHAYYYDHRRRLVRRRIALPEVIHYRTVARSASDHKATTALVRLRGQQLYNPPHIPGKLRHCCWLRAETELRDSVPETIRYTGARSLGLLLSHHPAVVLKRNWGSLGIGILRVRHSADGFVWEAGTGPHYHCASLAKVASGMRRCIADHQYLVQQSLQLARYRGRNFDLRCVVQRDGTGAWRFVGACLRLSGRNRIATNVSRGGRALRPLPILRAVFGEEAVGKYTDLQNFSIQVAAALTRHERGLADLGLDLAFGADGRLWFIEANSRPMRYSLSRSRQWARYRESYRLPMEYGYSLLQQKQTGSLAAVAGAEEETESGGQVGAS